MKTLKLFNAVVAKEPKTESFASELGFIIEPLAMWAKNEILAYYTKEKLNGNDLNRTFHKSWQKIKESSRVELLIHQLMHYLSTYGSNFQDEVYIPNEVLGIPDVELKFKVIKAYTSDEMTAKCLAMLKSGVALKEETVDDLISILVDELDYSFTGNEGIKNKEAIVKIAESYNVYPDNPVEFFRYVIYRTTDTTLLIKNDELIKAIKDSSYNPSQVFKNFGLQRLSEIFNRFKPLFLAFKNKCPKTINKISKLSKKHHKPTIQNPLNNTTNKEFKNRDLHWLDNATPFALFKALSACYSRARGQDTFLYRIRNGKSWVQEDKVNLEVCTKNIKFLINYIRQRFNLSNRLVYIPEGINYALPTSEKMFVGNIPTGTKFYGDNLAVGIYWENDWGARDLDLSGVNIEGKVGWNSVYNQNNQLYYSGDITNAPSGAVEYLYANTGLENPTIVKNNVFNGDADSGYKIIIGKGDDVSKDYMMNPNNLLAQIKTECVQNQMILGFMIPEVTGQSFVLLNFGSGHNRVSGNSEISTLATKALYQQWKDPFSLNDLLLDLGCLFVEKEKADIDLSLDVLERDTILKIFES